MPTSGIVVHYTVTQLYTIQDECQSPNPPEIQFQMGILCAICTISISTRFFRNGATVKRDLPVV